MKNVDLKKLYKEDRTACKIAPRLLTFAAYSLLFFSNTFAQIPINGFCKFQSFDTKSQFTKIITLDYNLDNITDLLLLGAEGNKFVIHPGDNKSIFKDAIQKYSFFPIDDLAPLYPDNPKNKFYIFVSREKRLAGLISFTKYGTMQILNQIKFDSYPSRVHVGDVDGDGKNEALISGENFNGLSILKEKNYILYETKIVTGKVFKDAKLIDLDYDSFSDIAAFDLLSNSIVFYYNTEFEQFREYRSIIVKEEIDELKIFDFNNDSYDDLLYHHGSGIEVLLGDSVSTFSEHLFFKTNVYPDKFTTRDFNKDGFNDIAYLNRESGDLYIQFAKSMDQFYEPVNYLHTAGLVDIIGFRKGKSEYIAVLDNSGQLYTLSKFKNSEDEMCISIGGTPTVIASFDSFVSNTRDLCFVDSYNNNLNLLINDENVIFSKYYQFRLSDQHTNILVDDSGESSRTFYLYSYGSKFVELINLDFATEKVSRDYLYTYSTIIDLQLHQSINTSLKTLLALVKQDSILSMIKYDYVDYKYVRSVTSNLKSGIIDACFSYSDAPSFYYWNISDGFFKNGFLQKIDSEKTDSSIMEIPLNQNTISGLFVKSFNLSIEGKDLPVSIVNMDKSTDLYFYKDAVNRKAILKGKLIPITEKKQFQLFSNPIKRKSFLYLYDSGNEALYAAEVKPGKAPVRFYKLFESMYSNSYFVSNLFPGKTYLVYTESTSNNIIMKRIE